MQGRQVLGRDRLGEEQEREEPALQVAVEEARSGPEHLAVGRQPEMRDARRHGAGRDQLADQRVIAVAAMFGRQHETVLARPGEGVAGMDLDDLVARPAQAGDDLGGKPGVVGEDEPGLPGGAGEPRLDVDLAFGQPRLPDRAPAPAGNVVGAREPAGRGRELPGAGLDEIGAALEGIGRQRHAQAPRPAPDRLPVRRHAHRPEPAEELQEIGVVGDRLLGVAERAQDLVRRHPAMGLGERAQRLARPHLQIDPRRLLRQRGDAVGEAHGAAQMRDPVVRARRLRVGDEPPRPVRDEGDRRRRQADAAQIVAEPAEDRLQHPGMGGDVDRDALAVDADRRQPGLQRVERRLRPGGHRQFRRVHARDVEIRPEMRREIARRQRHAQHAPGRHRVEELPAQVDEPDAILEGHHPGEAGGGVLAHRMADERAGLHAPGHPELGQRIFDDHDQRQLHRRPLQPEIGRGQRLDRRLGQPQRADVIVELRLQDREAAIHPFGEDRLGLVEIPRHPCILRAAAGKEEDDLRGLVDHGMGEDPPGLHRLQQARRLLVGRGHQHAAPLEGPPPLLEGEGDIGERLLGMGAQMRGKPLRGIVERRPRLRRQRQDLEGPVGLVRGRHRRRLLHHGMGIGAADAERIHPGPPRAAERREVAQGRIHPEGTGLEIDRRVRRLEAEARRDLAVVQCQRRLDETRDACRRVGMADVGLDRADAAEPARLGRLAEGRGQRRHLDRIAEIGAGAVAFDIADRPRPDPRHRMGLGDGARLPVDARRQIARLGRAVVVDRRALDDRPDVVAIGQRILQPAQHHRPGPRAEDRALGAMVEGMAMPVRRQDLALLEHIAAPVGQLDRHAARQRHVAFAVQERLTGEMRRHERGRAGGLQVDARPLQVEHMADPGGEEVLVVAGVAQQEHAGARHQIRVRADVEVEIAPHAAAGIDTDGALEPLRGMAGVFERLPGHLEELAVLRIEDRGFLRAEAEEIAVESLEALEWRRRGHVVAVIEAVGGLAGGQHLFGRVVPDALDPVAQVGPVAFERVRSRKVGRHADDRDVVPV